MTTKNDVTGDSIKSKTNSQEYRDNWDAIFGKKEKACHTCRHEYKDIDFCSECDVSIMNKWESKV